MYEVDVVEQDQRDKSKKETEEKEKEEKREEDCSIWRNQAANEQVQSVCGQAVRSVNHIKRVRSNIINKK